jgi:hypothetical protein
LASKSTVHYLTGCIDAKITAVKMRAEMIEPGTPASDRVADLLRELSSALNDFDARSVAVLNDAVAYRG